MFISLKIAWRFLITSKIQTLIIVLGIAVGVSVQVFIGLLSKGLEMSLLNKVVGNSAHIIAYPKKSGIENYNQKDMSIRTLGNRILSVAPVADYSAFVKHDSMIEPVLIRGFVPNDLNVAYNIQNKVYEGRTIENSKDVLVGVDLKSKLGLNLNDKINIVTIHNKTAELTIVGFYDLGAMKVNKTWLFTDLKTSQDLIGFGDRATSIEISIRNAYAADHIAKEIATKLSDKNLTIENWKTQNKLLLSAITGQRICSTIIQFFVLLAAILSIISILGISVVQKYKQIGILKAMGIRDSSAALIFMLKAFILGILGTGLGVLLVFIYIKEFNRYIISAEGTPLVNIIVSRRFIGLSSIIDVVAATLAAFYPAMKSFKLTPVEVIKNG